MKLFRPDLLVALLGFAGVAHATAAGGNQPLACTTVQEGFGFATLMCRVDAAAGAEKLRITASFSGVHDDSTAALVASDGQEPMTCGPGGRARISGDADGDTLVCPITLSGPTGIRELTVRFAWHHATPASFSLVRD